MFFFVFFNDTATTEIYTLSLHDALPISSSFRVKGGVRCPGACDVPGPHFGKTRGPLLPAGGLRSEEHTSERQSRQYLVCRLLLEKKTHPWPMRRVPSALCPAGGCVIAFS